MRRTRTRYNPTEAHQAAKVALRVVDDVLSYVKEGAGKPSAKERALFAAAVVFAYGTWENYVEQLAIELSEHISAKLDPERVPETVKKLLEKRTAWELSVSPGWRALWKSAVRIKAIGGEADKFGLNTAKAGQVEYLLHLAGIDFAFSEFDVAMIPEHLVPEVSDVPEAVNRLVDLRGSIVHTGSVPDNLRKGHVRQWRQFVDKLIAAVDRECLKRRRKLLTQ